MEFIEPEYDEVEDAYEIRASRERYEAESVRLLKGIKERGEFAELLKIAKPEKITAIREAVAQFDSYLESQEKVAQSSYELYQKKQAMWRNDMKTLAIRDLMEPELRKYVAENNPEKLELLEAMLDRGAKTH